MRRLLNTPTTYGIRFIIVTLTYGAVVWGGLHLTSVDGASIVWPAAAAGLAALFLWGLDLWPALALGSLCVFLAKGITPPLAVGVSMGNVLEALAGAALLRALNFNPTISRLGDSLSLILTAIITTTISASVTSVFLVLTSAPSTFDSSLWVSLWVGHAVSVLSFGPFFIYWVNRFKFTKTPREIIEGTVVFCIIAALSILIFWTPYGSLGSVSLVYVLIIPLVWASLRTGPRGISLALAIVGLVSATGILFGFGPLSATPNLSQALFGIQVLLGTFSIIFLPFTSITEERKDAVIALERHVGRLEVALQKISTEDQAKSDFIAILAHELRNPLSPILSSLELMKQRGIKQENERDVYSIASNINIIARLLDDLLDISRITQKKFKLQLESVELKSVIDQAVEIVDPLVKEREHSLAVVLPEEPVWLNADSVRLTQIFVNLLNNAAKYTQEGGRIELKAAREGDSLRVSVRDNGAGIEPERLTKIFEAFGGNASPGRSPGGLHVGLSLAKRMAELHRGTLEVKSGGKGLGSEFVVHLPLPATAPLPLENPRRMRRRFREKREAAEMRRVLLVDDNRAAADTLGKLMETSGHKVAVAYSGTEALALAGRERPQVAILDIGMPYMDGYELSAILREKFGGGIYIVALTGYGQREDRDRAREAGFDAHLTKPVSIADVERVLEELQN